MDRKAKRILLVLSFSSFLVMYVEAMMIPALPQILKELGYSITSAELSWIVTSYLLIAAISMPIMAKLGERFGKKRILILAMLIYFFSVTFSGFQTFYHNLVLFRGIQGIGAGVFPLSYAIIAENIDKDSVGVAQGILSSMFALGASVGLIIGAYIDYISNWQWSYHTIAPLVLITLILCVFLLPNDEGTKSEHIDVLGLISLGLSLLFFIYASSLAISDYMIYYVISSSFFLLFILIELTSKFPLVKPSILGKRNVMIANLTAVFIGMAQFVFYQPIVLLLTDPGSYGHNFNYIYAGLIIAPYSVVMLFVSPWAGKMLKKNSRKKLLIYGSFLMALGYALLAFFNSSIYLIFLWEILVSTGLAIDLVSSINLLTVSIPKETTSSNTGLNMVARTAGGVVGGAVSGIILTTFTYYYLFNIFALPLKLPNNLAFEYSFLFGAFSSLIILIISIFIR